MRPLHSVAEAARRPRTAAQDSEKLRLAVNRALYHLVKTGKVGFGTYVIEYWAPILAVIEKFA